MARRCRSAGSRPSSTPTSSATSPRESSTRAGAGADRPARAEASHRPFPAHARVRRPVQRRSVLGDECIGGMDLDGRPLVTRTSYRMLHTLMNLGPAPEPNMTVLWSRHLRAAFKQYCIRISRDTSSIQYENDDLMRPYWGDDYGIACCVSAMRLGKQMQFFGARVNLAKALLYAINGGRDEMSGEQVAPPTPAVTGDVLDYDEVFAKFDATMEWLARTYVHAMNCIHYMHDKYFYERLEMALHDRDILRTMAFGIAGMSVVADSLSAIKYAKVSVIRDNTGLVVDYKTEGDFPKYTAMPICASTTSPLIWCRASWPRCASTRPTAASHR